MPIENFAIFDIDGTLHKTEVMSLAAYEVVMREYGRPVPDRETLFSTYGANTETILRILGIEGAPAFVQGFIDRITQEEGRQMARIGECYEGVLPALRRLAAEGVTLGICSMCSEPYMQAFLDRFGLRELVPFCRNESAGTDKRLVLREMVETYRPRRAIMVGDRAYDKAAAAYSGIPFVGCTYGYAPEEVSDAPILAASGAELYSAVRQVLDSQRP